MKKGCIDPATGALLAEYELGLLGEDERRTFEAHLKQCEFCRDEIYDSAPLASALAADAKAIHSALARVEAPAAAGRPEETSAGLLDTWLARLRAMRPVTRILVPAAALAALVWVLRSTPEGDPRGIARIEPLPYVPLPVRDAGPSDAATLFERGMSQYVQQNWKAAAADLRGSLDTDEASLAGTKRDQARLYLGVSLLLSGDASAALTPLTEASRSPLPVLADRARWYLAQARLADGDVENAASWLEQLLDSVTYAEAADEQLRKLGRRGP